MADAMAGTVSSFVGRNHHAPANETILWDLLAPCNFGCDYCYSERLTIRPKPAREREVDPILDAFARHLPRWNVNISGGEPTLHRGLCDIVAGLVSRGHRVGLYTNLSLRAPLERLTREVDPTGIEFVNAGVHAAQRVDTDPDLSGFIANVLLLQEAAFPIHASYIVHPENLRRAEADVSRMRDVGVNVRIQVFRGVWRGATYPAAFTPTELELVERWESAMDRGASVRVDYTGDGASCLAGMVYLEMDPNGDCWRCAAYRSMRRSPLGNLFDGSLRLPREPARCTMWGCLSCRQGHAFNLEGLTGLTST